MHSQDLESKRVMDTITRYSFDRWSRPEWLRVARRAEEERKRSEEEEHVRREHDVELARRRQEAGGASSEPDAPIMWTSVRATLFAPQTRRWYHLRG